MRELVGECELTGRRTTFTRNGRPVVVLISHDEWLALRETIDVASDEALREQLKDEGARMKDGFVRLRFTERVDDDWDALSEDERTLATSALERIDDDPIAGAPLFEPLRGIWTFRTEHLRILYRIVAEARFVLVMSIGRAAP